MGNKFRWVLAVALCMVTGCASSKASRFEHHVQQLQPGTTTKAEVIKLFGEPKQYRQNADGSADYAYTKAKRSVVKGATVGTVLVGAVVAIPCLLLVPFTFGASLLWIPVLAGAGGVAGAAGGAAMKKPTEILVIQLDGQGIVENYQVVPANADERVLGLN